SPDLAPGAELISRYSSAVYLPSRMLVWISVGAGWFKHERLVKRRRSVPRSHRLFRLRDHCLRHQFSVGAITGSLQAATDLSASGTAAWVDHVNAGVDALCNGGYCVYQSGAEFVMDLVAGAGADHFFRYSGCRH